MDDELVDYALSRILDDLRIGKWVTDEVTKRLGSYDPEDDRFWVTYTIVANELIDAVREKNEPTYPGEA